MSLLKSTPRFPASAASATVFSYSEKILLLYLVFYFLVPYKPWGFPFSFHMPVLFLGLLVCGRDALGALRSGKAGVPGDVPVLAAAVIVFSLSAAFVHFREFSRISVQAYIMSFACYFFVRAVVTQSFVGRLYRVMNGYLILSGILILLQVNEFWPAYVSGFFGQTNFGRGTQGWGFANTHILAGGSIAWMFSSVFARYSLRGETVWSLREEAFWLSALSLGGAGLFYTLNRGAWLGAACALLLLAASILFRGLPKKHFLRGGIAVAAFLVLLKFLMQPAVYKMQEKLSFVRNISVSPVSTVSNDAASLTRLKAWGVALDAIAQSPFWGLGIGRYPEFYSKAFPKLFIGVDRYGFDDNPRQIPHNSYLYYASEAGLLAALALFVFFGYVFVTAWRAGPASQVFPFLMGLVSVYAWLFTSDFINERIAWIAIGVVGGLAPFIKVRFFNGVHPQVR